MLKNPKCIKISIISAVFLLICLNIQPPVYADNTAGGFEEITVNGKTVKIYKDKIKYYGNYVIRTVYDKYGVIADTGAVLIAPEYNSIKKCGAGHYCAYKAEFDENKRIIPESKKSFLFDKTGRIRIKDAEISEMRHNADIFTRDAGLTNRTMIFSSASAAPDKMRRITIYTGKLEKLFECTLQGEPLLVDNKYIEIQKNQKNELLDLKGNIVIPAKSAYTSIGSIIEKDSREYFVINKDGKTGIWGRGGKVYIPAEYRNLHYDVKPFNYVWAEIYEKNHRWICLDLNGNRIKNPDMKTAPLGRLTLSPEYSNENPDNGIAGLEKYTEIKKLGGGFYSVENFSGKYGVIDSSGKVLVPAEYKHSCIYNKYRKCFLCYKVSGGTFFSYPSPFTFTLYDVYNLKGIKTGTALK